MSEKYLNTTLSARERAEDLLSEMSLEEKFEQTTGAFMSETIDENLKSKFCHRVGSISGLETRKMTSSKQVANVQRAIQQTVMDNSKHHIPAIFHMEGLCGAFVAGAVSFPSGIGRASSFDDKLEEKIGSIVSRQERAVGFTHTFAPVLDISRDSRMGRQGETYGEDPTLAAAMGAAYTKGVQSGETNGTHSEAVAKHFVGFHNSEGGIHGAASDTPPRLLREVYAKPFQAAITESELRGIMPCYCTFNGEAASCSSKMLTELLRGEMKFDGLCVSDYSAISNAHNFQKMYESCTEAGYEAMSAGMDMELPEKCCYNDELLEWFRSGKADEKILDRAVLRILEAKFRMGLFEHPFALEGQQLKDEFFDAKDKDISLQSARESLVLLKNDGVLPLKKDIKRIAVIGPHADNPRSFFGGYTHISMAEALLASANSIAGIGDKANSGDEKYACIKGTQIQTDETEEFNALLNRIKPECKSLFAELKERLAETEVIYSYGYPIAGDDRSHYEEALNVIKGADACILTLGGKYGSCSIASMGEGVDGTDINLPICQDKFIERASKLNIPMIGIHFNGRPISSDAADKYLSGIIEAWNPSEMGAQAIVDVLTGKYNPCGKLPLSVAYNAGQIPVYYNHPNGSSYHQGESIGFANYVDMPHTPRYCFGYGLSYTSFAYSDIELSRKEISPDDDIRISFNLTNTGESFGTEIVQLYIKDVYASMTRPAMELAGFRRADLNAGESKRIIFTLFMSQLAFLDKDYKWKIEAGEIEVMIGASSDDIRLKSSFSITESRFIDGSKRKFRA